MQLGCAVPLDAMVGEPLADHVALYDHADLLENAQGATDDLADLPFIQHGNFRSTQSHDTRSTICAAGDSAAPAQAGGTPGATNSVQAGV